MEYINAVTFSQIEVFLAVEECGSFSAAARHLNRTQPAVTYAIEKLEDLVGFTLFNRDTYRPQLTEKGAALLPRARLVARELSLLGAHVDSLQRAVEPEVRLTVDGMFPMSTLMPTVTAFREKWPVTPLRLMVENLTASKNQVLQNEASIGLLASVVLDAGSFARTAIFAVDLISVAAASHPLVEAGHPVPSEELARHVQIVLTDRQYEDGAPEFGVLSPQSWRTSDLGAKHAMISAGLGWGSLPAHVVEHDIAMGRLRPIHVMGAGIIRRKLIFDLVWRAEAVLGPATTWLTEELAGLSNCG